MERIELLLGMALLLAMMAAVILCCSPYAPVVQPVAEIEALWAIEDEREESEAPLVTALECNGVPLAYDAQEDVFYCTLGLEQGEEWPGLHLTAPGAKGVSLVFEDDYAYDSCAEAIENGWAYSVMAYTDEAYHYFGIVFTGLPLITMETAEEITAEDTPAQVTVSAYGSEPVVSRANVHIRGASSLDLEKSSLKVNFIRNASAKRNWTMLPGIGLRSDIILNGMGTDELMMRDRLSWEIYDEILGEDYSGAFDARRTQYAELFINGEYRGLYLMMEPIRAEDELAIAGDSAVMNDSLYMTAFFMFAGERLYRESEHNEYVFYEWRYSPAGKPYFDGIEPYIDLMTEPDDAVFAQKAGQLLDMDSIIRYGILCQACGLADNVDNNMVIWAHQTGSGLKYRFLPWDLDISWGRKREMLGVNNDHWVAFALLDRVLRLDIAGARETYAEAWGRLREDVLSVEHIAALVGECAGEMERSGALVRNAGKWEIAVDDTGGYEIVTFAQMHYAAVDQAMEMLLSEETPVFLDDSLNWGDTYPMIFPEAGE